MDHKEIDERLPDFECSIDPSVLARMGEVDRLMATSQDRQWQALRYVHMTSARAHNLAVKTARALEEQRESQRKLFWGLVVSVATAIIVSFINARTK